MYEKYMVQDELTAPLAENGKTTGFRLAVRITYYRSLPLSCVEGFALNVDGVEIPAADTTFTIRGVERTWAEMETATDERWGFGETAFLNVRMPEGKALGTHEIEITEILRISYMPVPSTARWKQRIAVAG